MKAPLFFFGANGRHTLWWRQRLQIRKVQEDPVTRKADVRAMARHIDANTIALVGSAPQVRSKFDAH